MGETKKMIKLKDILMERISDIVYHFTTTEAANNIIGTNRFRLQEIPSRNVDPGRKYDMGYYMSVARTKIEGYTKNMSNFQCYFVRFELDGTKLSDRYKGGAYNYFQSKHGDNEYEEYEDRIYSKDMYIPNALNYIKRMDLDVSRKCLRGYDPSKVIKTAIKSGVPTFLYPSREKWAQQSGGVEVRDIDGYKLFMQSLKTI
jgi:hypothetical protein